MNNEIKEILKQIKCYETEELCLLILSQKENNALLDYITNLQQAIKDTKDTADDMLYELQQENERLKENAKQLKDGWQQEVYDKNEVLNRWYETQGKIDKAIEYINNFKKYFLDRQPFVDTRHIDLEYLLNILQGSDKE